MENKVHLIKVGVPFISPKKRRVVIWLALLLFILFPFFFFFFLSQLGVDLEVLDFKVRMEKPDLLLA